MQIGELSDLNKREINMLIDFYFEHKKEFKDLCLFEDFVEQFCNRCDKCNDIICVLDCCKECDVKSEIDRDFECFDRNKEFYVYKI